MKKHVLVGLAVLSLFATTAVPSFRAQPSDVEVVADIPFSFTVGETTLPAGKYVVKAAEPLDPNIKEVRSADGRTAVLFTGIPAQASKPPEKTELVFKHLGDRYFLSQIWVKGTPEGVELADSRAEKRLEEKEGKPRMQSVPGQSQKRHPKK